MTMVSIVYEYDKDSSSFCMGDDIKDFIEDSHAYRVKVTIEKIE